MKGLVQFLTEQTLTKVKTTVKKFFDWYLDGERISVKSFRDANLEDLEDDFEMKLADIVKLLNQHLNDKIEVNTIDYDGMHISKFVVDGFKHPFCINSFDRFEK